MRTLIATWLVVAMAGSALAQAPPTKEELEQDLVDCTYWLVSQTAALTFLNDLAQGDWFEETGVHPQDQIAFIAAIEQAQSVQAGITNSLDDVETLLSFGDPMSLAEADMKLSQVRVDQVFAQGHIDDCYNIIEAY